MQDFAFYRVHQQMIDLEAAGVHAFLRDESGLLVAASLVSFMASMAFLMTMGPFTWYASH
eukprot:COSAG06_NODE_24809_length_652_cov_0.743219_2_plen_59_part_01